VLASRPGAQCGVPAPFGPGPAKQAECVPLVESYARFWDVGTFTYRVRGYGAGTGTVVVVPSGRINVGRAVLTYGMKDLLWGSFLPYGAYVGYPWYGDEIGVTVLAQPFGAVFLAPLAATVTHAGVWGVHVRPEIETTYRLSYVDDWTTGRTEDVVIHVRPRVTLRRLGGRTFFTHVAALKSYTRKDAKVERLVSGAWQAIETVPLTYHSSARFRLGRLPAGSRIRVTVPERPGYRAGFSRHLSVGR
jgi:hypothetical protein